MIRPLAAADVEPLAASLAALPLMQRYRRGAAALAADLTAALARGEGLAVWDEAGSPLGITWYLPTGTFAMGGYLKLLAVTAAVQGRGAGSALLAAFEAGVTPHSRHAFLLVSDFNTAARRFYERHGYTQVGSLPRLVLPDVDELVYHRKLR